MSPSAASVATPQERLQARLADPDTLDSPNAIAQSASNLVADLRNTSADLGEPEAQRVRGLVVAAARPDGRDLR